MYSTAQEREHLQHEYKVSVMNIAMKRMIMINRIFELAITKYGLSDWINIRSFVRRGIRQVHLYLYELELRYDFRHMWE